jgi:hypothetical protein
VYLRAESHPAGRPTFAASREEVPEALVPGTHSHAARREGTSRAAGAAAALEAAAAGTAGSERPPPCILHKPAMQPVLLFFLLLKCNCVQLSISSYANHRMLPKLC